MSLFQSLLWVALGSGAGGALRFLISRALIGCDGWGALPFATLLVNLAGSLLLGFLSGLAARGTMLPPQAKLLLTTGLCGGFTTFSTFVGENIDMLLTGDAVKAIGYSALSLGGGLVLFYAGFWASRSLFASSTM